MRVKRQYLIDARKKKGLSQEDIAERLGSSQSFVSEFENGNRSNVYGLSVVTALKLAKAYGIRFRTVCSEELKLFYHDD